MKRITTNELFNYWAKLYTEQLKEGDGYSKLSKAIGIHILNFTSIPFAKKYHNAFHITEKESWLQYFKNLELHTIELSKFKESVRDDLADIAAKVKNALDMWSAFLTRNDLLKVDNLPKVLNNSALKKAINVLEVMNFNEEERGLYEGQLKWMRIEESALQKYGNDREAQGIEKTAINMLKQKVDESLIKAVTGFSQDIIDKLKNKM